MYIENTDDTVLDLQTGLMWQRCGIGQSDANCTGATSKLTWSMALQKVENINMNGGFAGYNDWRMPNILELFSLVEVACYFPTINETLFPATLGRFWSSTPFGLTDTHSWYVDYNNGYSSGWFRTENYQLRLVRNGP